MLTLARQVIYVSKYKREISMTISSQDNFCSSGNDVTKPSSASSLADSQNISKRLCCRMMAYPEIAITGYTS